MRDNFIRYRNILYQQKDNHIFKYNSKNEIIACIWFNTGICDKTCSHYKICKLIHKGFVFR